MSLEALRPGGDLKLAVRLHFFLCRSPFHIYRGRSLCIFVMGSHVYHMNGILFLNQRVI